MVKIRVKVGPAEIEVEAEPEQIAAAIELIPELISKLPVALPADRTSPAASPTSVPPQRQHSDGPVELPMVTVEKTDSLADIIGKLFAEPWGREKRKLTDVREALQSYGLNYPKQSVAVALLRLAKNSKVRRFKAEDGEFVYTTPTSVIVPSTRPAPRETLDEVAVTEQN